MKKLLAMVALMGGLLLGGCARTVVRERPVITQVQVPVQCPNAAERERLRRLRPTPLREQPMPPTAVERNARSQAQLGRYEAPGGWGDQVDAALNRCAQP